MASPLGLVAGIAMARAENVPSSDEIRVAIFPYFYGLTPMSVVVTTAEPPAAKPARRTNPEPESQMRSASAVSRSR